MTRYFLCYFSHFLTFLLYSPVANFLVFAQFKVKKRKEKDGKPNRFSVFFVITLLIRMWDFYAKYFATSLASLVIEVFLNPALFTSPTNASGLIFVEYPATIS